MKMNFNAKDWEEFDRQCEANPLICDSNRPLKPGETLEPAIRGFKKIEEDEELKMLFRSVYRGEC